jgi:hypothetical protein
LRGDGRGRLQVILHWCSTALLELALYLSVAFAISGILSHEQNGAGESSCGNRGSEICSEFL